MEIKKLAIMASLLLSSSVFAGGLTNGNDISIANKTNYVLSFMVNGKCSKDFGVVYDYSIKTIPKVLFNKACKNSPICEVMGYVGKKCSGKTAGGVKYYFNQNTIEVIGGTVGHVSVTGCGTDIFYTEDFSKD